MSQELQLNNSCFTSVCWNYFQRLIFFLFVSNACFANEIQEYFDILTVSPQAHENLSPYWPGIKRGLLELSAEVIGIFPKTEVRGILRDGVWFFYALRLATRSLRTPDCYRSICASYDSRHSNDFGNYIRS